MTLLSNRQRTTQSPSTVSQQPRLLKGPLTPPLMDLRVVARVSDSVGPRRALLDVPFARA